MDELIGYVVVLDGDIVCASEDKEDCIACKEKLRKADKKYVEEEYDMSEEDDPFGVSYRAGFIGDAESARIYALYESSFNEDGEYCGNCEDLDGLDIDTLKSYF